MISQKAVFITVYKASYINGLDNPCRKQLSNRLRKLHPGACCGTSSDNCTQTPQHYQTSRTATGSENCTQEPPGICGSSSENWCPYHRAMHVMHQITTGPRNNNTITTLQLAQGPISHCTKHKPAVSKHRAECRSATGSENCTQERIVAPAQITVPRRHNTIRHPGPQRAQKTAPRSLLEPVARAQRTVCPDTTGSCIKTPQAQQTTTHDKKLELATRLTSVAEHLVVVGSLLQGIHCCPLHPKEGPLYFKQLGQW